MIVDLIHNAMKLAYLMFIWAIIFNKAEKCLTKPVRPYQIFSDGAWQEQWLLLPK